MKRLTLLVPLLLVAAAYGDQLTFTFVGFGTSTVTANGAGFTLSPSDNTEITDGTTGISFRLTGNDSASTGAASSFTVAPTLVSAVYTATGPGSVLVTDTMGNTLLSGTMGDGGTLVSNIPDGNGAFLSKFTVDFVSPGILKMFRLTSFGPEGSFSSTFGSADLVSGPQLDGLVGGGDITIEAMGPKPVPEPGALSLAACGLLFCGVAIRRKTLSNALRSK